MKKLFGYYTALVTPFKNNKIDFRALEFLIEKQINAGINGLVIAGTTGEDSSLSQEEKIVLIREVNGIVRDRTNIIVGCAGNNTYEVIHKIDLLLNAGAKYFLISAPYYNRPTQEGVLQHYQEIFRQHSVKTIIYNVPSRCAVNISVETLNKLSDFNNVIAVKDAVTDLSRINKINMPVFSGEDFYALAAVLYGAVGCVSVSSNIAPKDCIACYNHLKGGNIEEAIRMHKRLSYLHEILFVESNPIPVKYMLNLIYNDISHELRLPLTTLSNEYISKLTDIYKFLELD